MDAHAQAWDQRYAASELVWSQGPNQFVESELADLPPGRAVDLAAGEGRNAIWLAQHGWQVTAVDFSQVGLDKGARLAGETEVEWVCADATTWAGPGIDDTYDLAVLAYLQLAAPQRRAALRNAVGALRTGGRLLVVAHDSSNLTEGTGGPQDPSVLYTADDILADLGELDVEVIGAGRVARVVEPEHGGDPERVAWDALVHLIRR